MKRNLDKIFTHFKLNTSGFLAYSVLETVVLLLLLFTDIISPYFYKEFIDGVLINGEMNRLFFICFLMLSVFIIRYVLRFIKLTAEMKYEYSAQESIRSRLFDSYVNFGTLDHEGEYLKLYDEYTRKFCEGFRKYRIEPVIYTLTVIVLAVISICIDMRLFFISILAITASFVINHICSEKIYINSEEYKKKKNENDNWIISLLENLSGIRGLGCSNALTDRYVRLEEDVFDSYARECKIMCGISILQDFNYRFLLEMVLYFYGGYLILNGKLLLGTFMAFLSYYKKIYRNVKLIGERHVAFKKEVIWFKNLITMVETAEVNEKFKELPPKKMCGEFLYIHGSFHLYGKEENVFCLSVEGVRIKRGSRVAIIGESGSGKTSFVKLVCGLYKYLGSLYVEKEPYFFDLSVIDNLLLIEDDRKKIERYLKICFEPEEIEELKLLCQDKTIGEGGCRLSGGQRERLNVVRVLLRSPSLIIWDEAMAQMDANVEKKMYEIISKEMTESTHLFVSHKNVFLPYADEVIYVENGKVYGENDRYK